MKSKSKQNGSFPSDKQQMKPVMEAIRRHRRFMVSAHINPEGDALGSALAMASLLKHLGKTAVLANQGGIPKAYEFFPRLVPVVSGPARPVAADVAITVDVPLLSRTGTISRLIRRVPLLINIDHHVSNQRFGHINWVDPKAAAVGEMIYRLYQAFGVRPTRDDALCMYVSIVTDTGSFRYMSTTPTVHKIAADLIQRGLSPLKVAQDLYECHSASDLRFLGKVLQSVRQVAGGKVAWVEVPHALLKRAKPGPEILDEVVNYPRAVRTAEVAFVLREQAPGNGVRVSFRSKGRVDVDQIARQFGGGGHRAASGCRVQGTLAQARAKVLKAVQKAF